MGESGERKWDDMVLVGTIARPHRLRGHVFVNASTDFAETRFAPGATLSTRKGADTLTLRVESVRFQNGRPILSFEGYSGIEQAEALAGLELRIPEDALQSLEDGFYYHHQLVGCEVVTQSGAPVGHVVKVDEGAGGSLLVVTGAGGDEVLIPLAREICVRIDVTGRRIEVAPPAGLLDLNETKRGGTPGPRPARS